MNIQTTSVVLCLLLAASLGGCSTSSPTRADVDDAQQSGEGSRSRFERQCINSGVKPGTPALIKCVDDLMDIHAE